MSSATRARGGRDACSRGMARPQTNARADGYVRAWRPGACLSGMSSGPPVQPCCRLYVTVAAAPARIQSKIHSSTQSPPSAGGGAPMETAAPTTCGSRRSTALIAAAAAPPPHSAAYGLRRI